MGSVRNCNLPEDIYYLVRNHVWARMEDGVLITGITDVAQNLAKTFIAYSPKKTGKVVQKGKSLYQREQVLVGSLLRHA